MFLQLETDLLKCTLILLNSRQTRVRVFGDVRGKNVPNIWINTNLYWQLMCKKIINAVYSNALSKSPEWMWYFCWWWLYVNFSPKFCISIDYLCVCFSIPLEELVKAERGDISELMTTSFSETRTTEVLIPAESEEEKDDEEEEERAFQNRPYPPRIGALLTNYKYYHPHI